MSHATEQPEVPASVNAARAPQPAHTVRVEPAGIDIEVRASETLFDAAWREGYEWPTICLGQALCTACHVMIRTEDENNVSPIVEPDERSAIRRVSRRLYKGDTTGVRLACQMRVKADIVVEQGRFEGERRADA